MHSNAERSDAVSEDEAPHRAERGVLSDQDTSEIQMLFCQMAHTCDIACECLGSAAIRLTGSELPRFKQMTARLRATVDRIDSLVG
jgi:hypothetical protein